MTGTRARKEVLSLASMHRRLVLAGIPSRLAQSTSDHRPYLRYRSRYAVQVCDLEAIRINQLGSMLKTQLPAALDRRSSEEYEPSDRHLRRLGRAAVKCLYTAGLRSGEVILISSGPRAFEVEAITPVWQLSNASLIKLHKEAEAAKRRSVQHEAVHGLDSLLLGMDPEFVLVNPNTNEAVDVSQFLERGGVAGCDAVYVDGIATYPLAELRPPPSRHPRGLLIALMRAMEEAAEAIDDQSLIWRAGGLPIPHLPLGGHLHFSGVVLTTDLLRALDNYLALPIAILEDERGVLRRPKYGTLGDFRRQPHGGFEYRTLPSFLVSPLVTKGVVCLGYLIVRYYRLLTKRPLSQEHVLAAYYKGDKGVLRRTLPELIEDLRSLPQYAEFSASIEPVFQYMNNGSSWDEQRDIRPRWRIPAAH